MRSGGNEYLIVAMVAVSVDPALVNAISMEVFISRAHLDNAKRAIVKCPLG